MSFHSPRFVVFFAIILYSLVINASGLIAQPRSSDQATLYTLTILRAEPQPRITITEVSHVKGSFKIPDLGKVTGYDPGWLVIKVTDASGKMIYETSCANPLDQYIEHVNEKGELDRKRVLLNEDIVSLRIPLNTTGYTVSLYSAESNSRLTLISVL